MSAALIVIGHQLFFEEKVYPCAIGKGGFSADKREGDGATPLGVFALRECWYRADRLPAPHTRLPLRVIGKDDGWCDDPNSSAYNRHIKIPLPVGERLGEGLTCSDAVNIAPLPSSPLQGEGYERLWREDHCYDLIVPMGYNDAPVVAGRGSAIFLHVMHDSGRATEGCVALAKADLLEILPRLDTASRIEIRQA